MVRVVEYVDHALDLPFVGLRLAVDLSIMRWRFPENRNISILLAFSEVGVVVGLRIGVLVLVAVRNF